MRKINYKIITLLLAASLLNTSCESYLEEENNTKLNIDDADANTYKQLVATVYERARETTTHYAPDLYYVLEDLGTDIVTRGNAVVGTSDLNDYVNFNSQNLAIGVYWSNQYKIISAANIVIDNADGIDGLEEADKNMGVAESKFFRAMSYFQLVENFGGVPLVLNQITTAERDFTRASEEDVYTQIIQDLEDALAGVDQTPNKYGRVSKDAVRHLLSKVLLTRAYKPFAGSTDFTDAAALAETVISNHALVGSFESLVSIENQRNSEVIFSYLFGSNSVSRGWGNSRHQMYKFRFFDYPGLTRTVKGLGAMPTPFYYSLFEDDDERAAATFARVIYATEDYTATVGGATVNVMAGDTAMYFPKTAWSQSAINAVRYRVVNPGTYFTNDGVTDVHYPQFKKFDDPNVPFRQPDTESVGERDMVMMRSGEAYLIAAEAYLGASNPTTAAARLTTLRSRAGLTTPVLPTEVTLDFILDERARELTGEVNRWMDLKRTGKLIERTLLHNPHAKLNNALNAKNLLRPIPQYEIDNSNGLTQNPL
ncbi:RagB/SusD family nutrient uptake outer membrane protein [Wenyingzhuangia sp. chi5]|uniref:RagB/SusD family nutrient uptake outer membrane protein n=1 Tax=Wenyingzhuangia gilva TaxID=3057677 RepID=A0ABT8VUJ2_9FLAO|nr:RagB/SusD family nutrient uptake outer membrane protein [Wenyingzhuangia sp. chi5]MDO3695643.1 RagB/SusD family nutrient uptake outer membrane protein [Wenyingzhuangia sp. chi5]